MGTFKYLCVIKILICPTVFQDDKILKSARRSDLSTRSIRNHYVPLNLSVKVMFFPDT